MFGEIFKRTPKEEAPVKNERFLETIKAQEDLRKKENLLLDIKRFLRASILGAVLSSPFSVDAKPDVDIEASKEAAVETLYKIFENPQEIIDACGPISKDVEIEDPDAETIMFIGQDHGLFRVLDSEGAVKSQQKIAECIRAMAENNITGKVIVIGFELILGSIEDISNKKLIRQVLEYEITVHHKNLSKASDLRPDNYLTIIEDGSLVRRDDKSRYYKGLIGILHEFYPEKVEEALKPLENKVKEYPRAYFSLPSEVQEEIDKIEELALEEIIKIKELAEEKYDLSFVHADEVRSRDKGYISDNVPWFKKEDLTFSNKAEEIISDLLMYLMQEWHETYSKREEIAVREVEHEMENRNSKFSVVIFGGLHDLTKEAQKAEMNLLRADPGPRFSSSFGGKPYPPTKNIEDSIKREDKIAVSFSWKGGGLPELWKEHIDATARGEHGPGKDISYKFVLKNTVYLRAMEVITAEEVNSFAIELVGYSGFYEMVEGGEVTEEELRNLKLDVTDDDARQKIERAESHVARNQ